MIVVVYSQFNVGFVENVEPSILNPSLLLVLSILRALHVLLASKFIVGLAERLLLEFWEIAKMVQNQNSPRLIDNYFVLALIAS